LRGGGYAFHSPAPRTPWDSSHRRSGWPGPSTRRRRAPWRRSRRTVSDNPYWPAGRSCGRGVRHPRSALGRNGDRLLRATRTPRRRPRALAADLEAAVLAAAPEDARSAKLRMARPLRRPAPQPGCTCRFSPPSIDLLPGSASSSTRPQAQLCASTCRSRSTCRLSSSIGSRWFASWTLAATSRPTQRTPHGTSRPARRRVARQLRVPHRRPGERRGRPGARDP
jgi:hypothetical protein